MFVLLPGRSLEESFEIGRDIAETITRAFPAPVKLQFEKVFLPSVLLAKKRYVGFSYESPTQASPNFDAKGIETVRRDQCPLVSRMMEQSLRILFTTKGRIYFFFL
jgi:DNA polymerase zeta